MRNAEEESEEGVVLSDVPHVGGVPDPGLDIGQVPGHPLLCLSKHLPGVPLQLLLTQNIDCVRDKHFHRLKKILRDALTTICSR